MSIALTCLFFGGLVTAQAESGLARESAKSLHVAFAPMEPIFQTAPALPTSRPDPALAYPAIPVSIIPPMSKPALIDVLPKSTKMIGEMIRSQTGLESGAETELKLRNGEGIGALLRRAGYDSASIAKAIDAVSGKVSLRRLQIGTKFQVASQGFRFSTKPGRDIYVIQHPDSGWLALTALRPIDRYMNFFQGTVDDSIYRAAMAAGINENAFNDISVSWAFRSISSAKFGQVTDSSFSMKPSATASTAKSLVASCIMLVLSYLTSNWDFSAMTAMKTPLAGMTRMAIQLREPLSARQFPMPAYHHLLAIANIRLAALTPCIRVLISRHHTARLSSPPDRA